jgi:DNA-binding beta-propeller fold protein YncE
MKTIRRFSTVSLAIGAIFINSSPAAQPVFGGIKLTPIGTYATGIWNAGGAEIVAHDPGKQRLFVVNALAASVDVLDIQNPALPTLVAALAFTDVGGVANSVAVHDGIIAVAIESVPKTDPGHVVLLDSKFKTLAVLEVGAQPDMLTFSKDGRWLLTANEGEPDGYLLPGSVDPEGSVSIIDLSAGAKKVTQSNVRTVNFHKFEPPALIDPAIRIYGPGANVSQDLEPEYIAISADSQTAWVTLQENNALAIIDIPSAKSPSWSVLVSKIICWRRTPSTQVTAITRRVPARRSRLGIGLSLACISPTASLRIAWMEKITSSWPTKATRANGRT